MRLLRKTFSQFYALLATRFFFHVYDTWNDEKHGVMVLFAPRRLWRYLFTYSSDKICTLRFYAFHRVFFAQSVFYVTYFSFELFRKFFRAVFLMF